MSHDVDLGEFEIIVLLALIDLGEDAYGVPISHEIRRRTGREVALGSIYSVLEILEAKRLVASRLADPTELRGGRAKRYFSLTAQGLRKVRQAPGPVLNPWRRLAQLDGGTA